MLVQTFGVDVAWMYSNCCSSRKVNKKCYNGNRVILVSARHWHISKVGDVQLSGLDDHDHFPL